MTYLKISIIQVKHFKSDFCDSCTFEKLHRQTKGCTKTRQIGELIHTDISELCQTKSCQIKDIFVKEFFHTIVIPTVYHQKMKPWIV